MKTETERIQATKLVNPESILPADPNCTVCKHIGQQTMSSKPRHSDPYWNNGIEIFKVPRRLVESGLLMELSPDAIRMFLLVSYWLYRNRVDYYQVRLDELNELGWSNEQSHGAAAEIVAAGLMRLSNRHNNLEFRI